MNKYLLSILTIFFICIFEINAQVIEQTNLLGARNAGMGDADISSSYDISSMYENPATTVFMRRNSIMFNHAENRNGMGMVENLTFPILPSGPQMLSFGLQLFHFGYLDHTPGMTGVHILEYGYDVALSTLITPTFSVGALAGIKDGITNQTNTWAASYSVGLVYSPSSDINYAIVYRGRGNDIQYQQNDSVFDAVNTLQFNKLEIGASMSYPSTSSLRRRIFSLSLANEKIFGISGLYYKGGLEIIPIKFLSLRFGYIVGPGINEPRYGIGFRFDNFRLEYVYYSNNYSDLVQQFSLVYEL